MSFFFIKIILSTSAPKVTFSYSPKNKSPEDSGLTFSQKCRTAWIKDLRSSISDSFIRTIPSVSEFHRISRKARRLYCRWGISPRPEDNFYIIIWLYIKVVNSKCVIMRNLDAFKMINWVNKDEFIIYYEFVGKWF